MVPITPNINLDTDMLMICLTLVGALLILLPLYRAFHRSVDYANFAQHRVTPASPWFFFNKKFFKEIRLWTGLELCYFLIYCCVMAYQIADPDRDETFWEALRDSKPNFLEVLIESVAFYIGAINIMLIVALVLVTKIFRFLLYLPCVIILSMACYASVIASLEIPPPSSNSFPAFVIIMPVTFFLLTGFCFKTYWRRIRLHFFKQYD